MPGTQLIAATAWKINAISASSGILKHVNATTARPMRLTILIQGLVK
jgi:hypothetical protein